MEPATGRLELFEAPRGHDPSGITTTPDGDVYHASLAGRHIARIDTATGRATVLELPTEGQGARRICSDSRGRLWIASGTPGSSGCTTRARIRGESGGYPVQRRSRTPSTLPSATGFGSAFGANALVRFDPETERFTEFPLPSDPANVRQLLGRPGEVWGAESAADALVVVGSR